MLEFAQYVAISAGMALAASCYAMVAGLFSVTHGVGALIAIAVAGLLCMVVSTAVAELASMYPSAPGISTYLKSAFGERISLSITILYVSLVAVLAGVESFIFSEVLAAFFPALSPYFLVVALLVTVIVVNLLGREIPRNVQLVVTALLLGGMVLIAGWALLAPDLGPPVPAPEPSAGQSLPSAIGMAMFLFIGFEWVAPLGRSPRAYDRLIPMAMPVAIVALILVYGLFATALAAHFPRAHLAGSAVPQMNLAGRFLAHGGIMLAAGLSLLAMASSFNAGLMGASRLVYGLAREGKLPRWCAWISLRTGSPIGAVLLLGAIALCAALLVVYLRTYLLLASIGALIECIVYGGLLLAVLKLRGTHAKRRRYRSPIPPALLACLAVLMPILGIAALLSQPGMRLAGVLVFAMLATGAAVLAHWSIHYQRRARRECTNLALEKAEP